MTLNSNEAAQRLKRTLALRRLQRFHRVWGWRPCLYWHGLSTLSPIFIGHDEYARRTLVLGWTMTGRIIFALEPCGDEECERDAVGF